MDEKNRRSFNFSEAEVECLVALVHKFQKVVENKESDVVSWQQKNLAWESLCKEFNRMGFNTRTPKQLREKWINIKKECKKKFAAEKLEMYKTGGGIKKVINITDVDVQVKEIIGVAVTGLYNSYDGDCSMYQVEDYEHIKEIVDPQAHGSELESEVSVNHSENENWSRWNPKTLRRPLSEQLVMEPNSMVENGPTWSPGRFIPGLLQKKENEKKKLQMTSKSLPAVNSTIANAKTLHLKLVNPNKIKAGKPQIENAGPQHIPASSVSKSSVDNEITINSCTSPEKLMEVNSGQLKRKRINQETPKKLLSSDKCARSKSNFIKKKTQLTTDCRVKINTLSEAKLELVTIQRECLIKEQLMKDEEHSLKIQQSKAEHDIVMQKHIVELEILKNKLKEVSQQE